MKSKVSIHSFIHSFIALEVVWTFSGWVGVLVAAIGMVHHIRTHRVPLVHSLKSRIYRYHTAFPPAFPVRSVCCYAHAAGCGGGCHDDRICATDRHQWIPQQSHSSRYTHGKCCIHSVVQIILETYCNVKQCVFRISTQNQI